MPHVTGPNGKDLGEVTSPSLLAYYRGEGYQIDDGAAPQPAAAAAAVPDVPVDVPPAPEPPVAPVTPETPTEETSA